MSSFRACSVLNHRLPADVGRGGWIEGVVRASSAKTGGHLSPERQISGCQRTGSFWKAREQRIWLGRGRGRRKKKKKNERKNERKKKYTENPGPPPPLFNKLIKSYPNRPGEPENSTRTFSPSGLRSAVNFPRESGPATNGRAEGDDEKII